MLLIREEIRITASTLNPRIASVPAVETVFVLADRTGE